MRGVKIAVVVICVGLAFSILGPWFAWVGVSPAPGIDTKDTQKDLDNASGQSSGGASDFGIVRSGMDTFNTFRSVMGEISDGLVNLGVPLLMADAVETLAYIAIGVAIVYMIRGVVGR